MLCPWVALKERKFTPYRLALALTILCGLVFAAPQGWAADYPSRPIKLIVPYAAGGPSDVQARIIGEYLGRDLKQTIVIENRAGAQGAIGAEMAARSEPDGYTLFMATVANTLNPAQTNSGFNLGRDMAPVALLGMVPNGHEAAETNIGCRPASAGETSQWRCRMAEPPEGIVLTHFIVSDDVERSRRFYTEVLGGGIRIGDVEDVGIDLHERKRAREVKGGRSRRNGREREQRRCATRDRCPAGSHTAWRA
ncbi:hypothetical protein B4Q13_15695 [Lacticaseibacillus rhamnosus]